MKRREETSAVCTYVCGFSHHAFPDVIYFVLVESKTVAFLVLFSQEGLYVAPYELKKLLEHGFRLLKLECTGLKSQFLLLLGEESVWPRLCVSHALRVPFP